MKSFLTAFLLVLVCYSCAFSFGASSAGGARSKIAKEELIPAEFILSNIGKTDIDVIFRNGHGYLPVVAIFNYLGIKADLSQDGNIVRGFYPTDDKKFSIEFFSGKIHTADTTGTLGMDDYTFSDAELFLREDLFKVFFKLELQYSPRRLVVTIRSKPNLPVFEARMRQLRRQGLLLRNPTVEPDYTMGLNHSLFEFGKVNWSLSSRASKLFAPLTQYSLQGGGKFLAGDFSLAIRDYFGRKVRENNVHENLRYVFESPALRQINLGDLSTIGANSRSLLGAEITNRPPARRLLFGNQELRTNVASGNEVEFYYNNGLRSYFTSPADTEVSMSVPLRYGLSDYDFRTYSKYNEVSDNSFRYVVPTGMIPRGEVQYSVLGGKIRGYNYKYGSASIARGFTSALTMGTGVELYERGFAGRVAYPFINGTARILSSLTGDVMISPLSTSRLNLDYQLPNQVRISGAYTSYSRDRTLNPIDLISSVAMSGLAPFKISNIDFGLGVIAQSDLGRSIHTRSLSATFGARYNAISAFVSHRISQYSIGGEYQSSQQFTDLNASFRAPANFIFHGSYSYDHLMQRPYSINLGIERLFFNRVAVELSYLRVFSPSAASAFLRVYYQLPFVTLTSRTERNLSSNEPGQYIFNNSASGSFFMSTRTGDFLFLPTQHGNYGAIIVRPFVDNNDNGIPDPGEEYLPKTVVSSRSTLISAATRTTGRGTLVANSEPYQSYVFSVDQHNAFDNPHWVSRYQGVQVTAEPNTLKMVNYPITVGGTIHGSIGIAGHGTALDNVGGVKLILRRTGTSGESNPYTKTTRSFTNGQFEFAGIPPGVYEITLDASDLLKLGAVAKVASKQVTIQARAEGDQVEGVSFELQ